MKQKFNPKMSMADAAEILQISIPALHARLKSSGLDYSKYGSKLFFKHETAKKVFAELVMQKLPKIMAFHNVRGGVGKSLLAFMVAVRANLLGVRVLVIDADKQGNLSESFGIDSDNKKVLYDILKNPQKTAIQDCIVNICEGLDLIPSNVDNAYIDTALTVDEDYRLLNTIYPNYIFKDFDIHKNYDLVIFDCPPEISYHVQAITLFCDQVIVPVTPDKFSVHGLEIIQSLHEKLKKWGKIPELKIVFNKFDNRTSLSVKTLTTVNQKFSKKMFDNFITQNSDFPNAIERSLSVYDNLKSSDAKIDIDLLTKTILGI